MDIRMLSLGKYNLYSSVENSACFMGGFFDWIDLKKLPYQTNKTLAQNVFNYSQIIRRRSEQKENEHLQEVMILASEKETVFLEKAKFVYISLINIPIWNENKINRGDDYAELRKEIVKKIEMFFEEDKARVYYTFDHCDLILLCDGTKISLNEYMSTVKRLRTLTIELNGNAFDAVHDITTLCGCVQDEFSESDCKINFTLEISVKQGKNYTNDVLYEIDKIEKYDECINVIGRYDYLISWKYITLSKAFEIIKYIQRNENFFAHNVHFGVYEEKNREERIENHIEKKGDISLLVAVANDIYKQNVDCFLKKINFDEELLVAINEINNSILNMTDRGFAQYYLLAFFESYYSFIMFLKKKWTEYIDGNGENEILERIYDIFRQYFSFLNALNACTIHSERQFLQVDSYQLMYFDAPPKLLAFYTSIANKITYTISVDDSKDKYTFLITPDFKKDIFVESITEDRSVGNEQNILVIHMNEEGMYDVTSTLKIIAHEIYHHIGQNTAMRKYRATLYMKCCIGLMISYGLPAHYMLGNTSVEKYIFYKKLIDEVYNQFMVDFLETIDGYEGFKKHDESSVFYYSDDLIRAFVYYLYKKSGKLQNVFLDALDKIVDIKDITDDNKDFWDEILLTDDGGDRIIYRDFIINKMAYQMSDILRRWVPGNYSEELYSHILFSFRESYADTRMLILISEIEKDEIEDYLLMFNERNKNEENPVQQTRIASVLRKVGRNDKHNFVKDYEKTCMEIYNSKKSLEGMFYMYLYEMICAYLEIVNEPTDKQYLKIKNDIKSVLQILKNGKIDELIKVFDKEIFEYRVRLVNQD